MEPKIITDPADVAGLEFGTPYILDVGFNDAEHDVEAFAEAYQSAKEKAAEAVANAGNEDVKPDEEDPALEDEGDKKTPPGQDKKTIAATHTVAALRKMATEHKIVGRSKMGESELIDALVSAGAFTS